MPEDHTQGQLTAHVKPGRPSYRILSDDIVIGIAYSEENAKEMARRWNAYEGLVAALETAESVLQDEMAFQVIVNHPDEPPKSLAQVVNAALQEVPDA